MDMDMNLNLDLDLDLNIINVIMIWTKWQMHACIDNVFLVVPLYFLQ